MKQFKARLFMLMIIILLVTAGVVYITFDSQMIDNLKALKLWSIFAVGGLLTAGMYFDGVRLKQMVKMADEHITLTQAMEVVFSNYFLALMTPGATGGPIAQVLLLRQAGLAFGKATVLVVGRTMLSILELVVLLPIVLYFDSGMLPWIPKKMFIVILGLFSIIGGIAIWILKNFNQVNNVVQQIFGGRGQKFIRFYQECSSALLLLGQNPIGILKVFAQTFLSLLALYSIVPVIFFGMGVKVTWYIVLGRLVLLNLLLYFSPTPGGMVAAEAGFIYLFGSMFQPSIVGIAALLWRLFSEYLPFFIGLMCVIRVIGLNALKNKMLMLGEGGNA